MLDVFRAPIQILIGVAFGVLFGLVAWVLPSKNSVSDVLSACVILQCHVM